MPLEPGVLEPVMLNPKQSSVTLSAARVMHVLFEVKFTLNTASEVRLPQETSTVFPE